MDDHERERVRRLYGALSANAENAAIALCDPAIRFEPGVSPLGLKRSEYLCHSGIRDFLAEIRSSWDEVTFTPFESRSDGGAFVVGGRIFARAASLGIRDFPVIWRWESEDGLFTLGCACTAQMTRRTAVVPPRA